MLFLLYDSAVLARDFMAMKQASREMDQQQRDLDRKRTKTRGLQLNANDQIQASRVYNVGESWI